MRSQLRLGAAAALAAALVACGGAELPVLGTVPPFALTAQDGTPLTADALRGRVWVVDFIFTRCPDVCPVLTQRMRRVREALPGGADGVQVVSLSVDPAHDTPDVLRAYADRHRATSSDWRFATGPRDAIARLLREGFMVAFADDGPPAQPITHSDRFVLVDRQLRLRGFYHGTDPDDVERLVRDAARLHGAG